MKKGIWWMIAIVVVILVVIALNSGKKESDTFKIGISTGITGSAAFAGEGYRDGALAAIKRINTEGGINGKQVELIFEDNMNLAKEGVTAFQKLMSAKPDFYVQTFTVASAAASPIAEQAGIPLFVSVSSARTERKYANSVSFYQTPEEDVRAVVQDMKINKITDVAMIYLNTEYGQSTIQAFREEAGKNGIRITAEESFLPTATDYTTIATKILAAKPKAIFVVAISTTPIIKQLKSYKTTATIFATNPPVTGNLVNTDKETYEGVHLTGYRSAVPGTIEYQKIRKEIPELKEGDTNGYFMAAYENMLAIRAVLNKDPNPANFVKTFASYGIFEGENGIYDLNARTVSMPLYPVVLKNGVLTEVK